MSKCQCGDIDIEEAPLGEQKKANRRAFGSNRGRRKQPTGYKAAYGPQTTEETEDEEEA